MSDRAEFAGLTTMYFGRPAPGAGSTGDDAGYGPTGALLIVDARHPEVAQDLNAWAWLSTKDLATGVVVAKIDPKRRVPLRPLWGQGLWAQGVPSALALGGVDRPVPGSEGLAGDFSQRVAASFADDELNALADSVNTLLETVQSGLSETCAVLAELSAGHPPTRVF